MVSPLRRYYYTRDKEQFMDTVRQRKQQHNVREAEVQRRTRILTFLGRKDIPERGKQRVVQRTIKREFVKPEPRQETIMTRVEPGIGTKYTVGAYQGYTAQQYKSRLESWKKFDTSKDYIISGKLFPGELVKPIYFESVVEPSRKQFEFSLGLKPYHSIKRTETGFEISGEGKARSEWEKLSIWEQAGKALWVGTTQWPRTITEGLTSIITLEPPSSRGYARSLAEWEMSTWEMAKSKDYGGLAKEIALSPAMTHVVYPITGGAIIGTGVGAVSGVSVTGGRILGGGIAAYSAYSFGTSAIEDPVGTISTGIFTAPLGYLGYKQGYTYGYGRVEQFAYLRKTYGYGTPGYLRAKSILKTARGLQNIKTPRGKFDIVKDIKGMDTGSAKAMELFMLKYKGKFTLAGSGVTKGQLGSEARLGRDIDIFMKKGKYVPRAKSFLKRQGAEQIYNIKLKRWELKSFDIHGPKFYKPGQYHKFGFVEKKGVPLDVYSSGRYLGKAKGISVGEQLFRKAVAVSRLERQYRWGDYPGIYKAPPSSVRGPKDIADVVNISESVISRASKSWNPFTRISGRQAGMNLSSFFTPSKYTRFPLFKAFASDVAGTQMLVPTMPGTQKITPTPIKTYPVGTLMYPTMNIPLAFKPIPIILPKYISFKTSKSPRIITPSYSLPPSVIPGYALPSYAPLDYTTPSYAPLDYTTPSYAPLDYTTPSYTPGLSPPPPYTPSSYDDPSKYTPPYYPPNITPPYKPPYKPPPSYPPGYPPSYTPPYYPPGRPIPPKTPPPLLLKSDEDKPKLSKVGYDVFVKDRFIVSGKKKYSERFVKLSKKPMSKSDAKGFGAEIVDQSAAASFKIKRAPTSKGAKGIRTYPSPIRIRGWGTVNHMFYTKTKNNQPVYIEKTDFRINTPGELQGISARGWLAQRTGKRKRKHSRGLF